MSFPRDLFQPHGKHAAGVQPPASGEYTAAMETLPPEDTPPLTSRIPGATLPDTQVFPVWKPPENVPHQQVIDGLQTLDADPAPLPATLLRAVSRDGDGKTKELLTGWPVPSGGMRVTETGQMVAGLCLGTDGDIDIWVENTDPAYWHRLAAAAERIGDMQEQARENPQATPAGTEGEVA